MEDALAESPALASHVPDIRKGWYLERADRAQETEHLIGAVVCREAA
jgi:hypothetical protein